MNSEEDLKREEKEEQEERRNQLKAEEQDRKRQERIGKKHQKLLEGIAGHVELAKANANDPELAKGEIDLALREAINAIASGNCLDPVEVAKAAKKALGIKLSW